MRRFFLLLAVVVALFVSSARPAQARLTVAELLQPVIAEIDRQIALLPVADVKLKAKIEDARALLTANGGNLDDAAALAALKKISSTISKIPALSQAFAPVLKTALDGFAAVVAELRTSLNSRITGLADPALKAKATKGLTKLVGFLTAASLAATPKERAKQIVSALKQAVLVADQLAKCPGHPGEFGHGQVLALLGGTDLFKPKFASGEMLKDAGGQILNIHIDGYHFPYEKGTVALDFHAPVGVGPYSFAAGNLSANYQKDNETFLMESGTATIDEFDPVTRRIVARFEFTGRDFGSNTTVTLSSGTLVVCDFKVKTSQ